MRRIAFYGSSLVSSYWNGAATYYRGLLRNLARLGYDITFYEPDAYDRQKHRDIDAPAWARSVIYPATAEGLNGAIAEAAYALDVLKADGVVLLANVHGQYLGDAAFDPLMAALNERGAAVFVHPSHLPGPDVPGIPAFAADFLLDTTRAALNIAKSGALERYPDLKIILSHAGGFVPYAAERMARVISPDGQTPGGLARLRKFWFDTALSSSPYALPALLAFADPARITFGSDWPYAPAERSLHFTRLLEDYPLTEAQRHAIDRGNAEALFPRLVQT